jgi:hypothetical protein
MTVQDEVARAAIVTCLLIAAMLALYALLVIGAEISEWIVSTWDRWGQS